MSRSLTAHAEWARALGGAGVWLGVDRRTGQYLIFDKGNGGLKMARTIKPMPASQQWVKEKVEQVDITPWSLHGTPPPMQV